MLKSMTAYACEEISKGELTVGTEIKSYNSRYLDIALRLPPGYAAIEEKVKRLINRHVVRGRIEIRVSIKDASESTVAYEVDIAKAKSYIAAVGRLKDALQLSQAVTLEQMIQVPGIIQVQEKAPAVDDQWPVIEAALEQALAALDAMRRKEGDFLEVDLSQRLNLLANTLDAIASAAGDLPAMYREKLESRIEALTKGVVELDPVRLAQEAAVLADRSDIQEEIVRARSHLVQFEAIIASEEPAGRKLNFLLQELNREFNTMGSKIGQAEIAHSIVAVKAELEKMREQVQNIE